MKAQNRCGSNETTKKALFANRLKQNLNYLLNYYLSKMRIGKGKDCVRGRCFNSKLEGSENLSSLL